MSNLGDARSRISFPAARNEGLLVETVGDETVVYDLASKEAHCLKPLAAAVFTHADGRTSAEELANKVEADLGEPITEAQVREAIAQLEASALLDVPSIAGNGLTRRRMIGKSAATAGGAFVGASLITTILAPAAGATNPSQILGGCSGCRVPPDCATNHCCQPDVKNCNNGCCVGQNNSCQVCTVGGQPLCTVAAADIGGQCPDPSQCPHGTCCSATGGCP